ncbi:MAG: sigma-54 dependent transcriptional regulator [Gammaproteobacteria bacterium]|nr:sigma-54 dependent transcriptional regulator [Gammaproteobacteria bacterium]
MSTLIPIAEDARSKATLEVARKAAKSQATVLITGETGVGKEILARYIHTHSAFNTGPFVSVNCAALPDNMVEAILFGYEKGAFTSAINSYIGKFEEAQNGTLLLDEISEIPLTSQAKLLRALQEREIERLGGKKVINVHIRIIAASNRDLHQQVTQGLFRKDLYYRLNVIPIHCLALKDRPNDIIPLAEYFIVHHAKQLARSVPYLTDFAKEKLLSAYWPGNIRELENVIQRTLIMTDGDSIDVDDIHLGDERVEMTNAIATPNNLYQFSSKLEAHEANIIMEVLQETEGCRTSAARKLRISPRTLRYKISKLKSIGFVVP